MKKTFLITLIILLAVTCVIQQCLIQAYKQSEKEWVEISELWREKIDTCINRNERIYEQLNEFKDIRIKQLKGELPK